MSVVIKFQRLENKILKKFESERCGFHPSDRGEISRFWLYCLCPLVILILKLFNKLFGFPIFWLWATWLRLFQKRVVGTQLDIYVLITCSHDMLRFELNHKIFTWIVSAEPLVLLYSFLILLSKHIIYLGVSFKRKKWL
jgi:hypothetical protein